MEENVAVVTMPSNIIPESRIGPHIIEEGPRICPLCSSEIRLFFIHFNEKMLMCENTECDYPFGYEDLHFVRMENEEEISDATSSRSRAEPFSSNASNISTSGWSEIDRINRVCESDDSQLEGRYLNTPTIKPKKANKKLLSSLESEKQIQKNVADLKGLNKELMEITKTKKMLKNEKWIKNLMHLQDCSGKQLLQPQEMKKLSQKEKKNELKIDIEPGDKNSVTSIKIEIANKR